MQLESGNTIISGIEPVDELMGGLERGQLYMVHGEASGKSLFGIKFLIEGLKQGENGALVIRYSPEDAVRRFARLGYDCLEDVYSGRLVILEYSDDIIQKIGKLSELTPVLRELEWLLGETQPVRLIFDPVASVLAGSEGNLDSRALEFAEWARSFGATVVLIANESNHQIIKSFEPLVVESFRFDVRDVGERAARFLTFEKSSVIPDQAIEVDPTRGVFLLGRAYELEDAGHQTAPAPQPPSMAELESIREELRAARSPKHSDTLETIVEIDLTDEASTPSDLTREQHVTAPLVYEPEPRDARETRKLTPVEERDFQAPRAVATPPAIDSPIIGELELGESIDSPERKAPLFEGQLDELSYLLDDLTGSASPLDLDLPEFIFPAIVNNEAPVRVESESTTQEQEAPMSNQPPVENESLKPPASVEQEDPISMPPLAESESLAPPSDDQAKPRLTRHGRASDIRIDSAMAARAVEMLLQAPQASSEVDIDYDLSTGQGTRRRPSRQKAQAEPANEGDVRPSDFNVLIIEDDPDTCDLLTETLGDYSLEVVHDGVSGLAKLISFKPDLVVLDFDLPVIDGFKVLTLIRSALNVPIIILSGSRMRAIDRVMASELGADYYLTKPFSTKELKHKARQLIARYRGLSSWIMNPAGATPVAGNAEGIAERSAPIAERDETLFTPYDEFAAEVDRRVKAAMDNGAPFSVVGCRLPQMTADGGRMALKLFDIVRGLARDADLTSTNPRNDLVILLADAGASGARSFAARLRARVTDELNQEPEVWMRSFPDLEEATEADTPISAAAHGVALNRRAGDQTIRAHGQAGA